MRIVRNSEALQKNCNERALVVMAFLLLIYFIE